MPPLDFEIDIGIRDAGWDAVPELAGLARIAVSAAAKHHCPRSFTELSILFTGNAQIKDLNRTYRGKDKPTNVLSFSTDPAFTVPVLGDIVLAFGVIADEACNSRIALEDHVTHLLIHGYLHLQGVDHRTDDDAAFMEALEIKALADLGIANPYDRDRA